MHIYRCKRCGTKWYGYWTMRKDIYKLAGYRFHIHYERVLAESGAKLGFPINCGPVLRHYELSGR